jgi:hypothetical protein
MLEILSAYVLLELNDLNRKKINNNKNDKNTKRKP